MEKCLSDRKQGTAVTMGLTLPCLVAVVLTLLGALPCHAQEALADRYCPVSASGRFNDTYRTLAVSSRPRCAAVCRAETNCSFWAYQGGSCHIGCFGCEEGVAGQEAITQAWISKEKGA